MSKRNKSILVTGSTGNQGRAAVSRFLAEGWDVRAFTRNPDGEAAKALAAEGAQIFAGDIEDRASLDRALAGVHGVFAVLPPTMDPTPQTDIYEGNLGKAVVDAAKAAGVAHLIFSSVAGAEAYDPIRPEHKFAVERHIWQSGLTATVLRPVAFMENFINPDYHLQHGLLYDPTNPDVPEALIAVEDIAAFAAIAFDRPSDFAGKTLTVAGDVMLPPQIAATLADASGEKIAYSHVSHEFLMAKNDVLGRLFEYVNRNEDGAPDIDALREIHPDLLTLRAWLDKKGAARIRGMFADVNHAV